MVPTLLELLRVWLLPTAWADILAGACLNGSATLGRLLPALLVSSSLYLFGMVTNAIADRKRDAELYPRRPLPSGRCHTVAMQWRE